MNISFKQGIVKYPFTGNIQSFLQTNGSTVNLVAINGSTLLTFSHGQSNYSFEEFDSITSAWTGPFTQNIDYWLYWDINTFTGIRTFGHTELQPLIGSTKPTSAQEGQHWFNLTTNKMYVFETAIWRPVIRVFAALYDGSDFTSLGLGIGDLEFAGSQIGLNIQTKSGKILFNENDKPILNSNKEFYTTESIFNINGSNIDSIRLESTYTIAKANETLPKYHIITYVDDGIVELANYSDVNSIIGMVTEDTIIHNLTNIILDGVVINPDWNWTDPIGTSLWVIENGELVTQDPHTLDNITYPTRYPPIAKILSSTSIVFDPTYQTDAEININIPNASTTESGIVKLATAPTSVFSPIAVGDNDPRLTDDRNPLPHTHDALDISFTSDTGLSSTDVKSGIDEVNISLDSKANLTGVTFTGDVILNGDPSQTNQAVNKKYVDDLVNGLIWIDPIQYVNIVGDTILSPPLSPRESDTYIIPVSGTPTGDWSGLLNNDIVQWNGSTWNLLENLNNISSARFGVSFENTIPFGTFLNHKDDIATYDGVNWTFETPIHNNAILVNNVNDTHAYHQFVFDTKWIEYAGPHSILPGTNLYQTDNTIHVKDVVDGGTIDALTLDGKSKTDFIDKSGDTMLGDLILDHDPVLNLEAATKQYVDNNISTGSSSLSNLNDVDPFLYPSNNDILYYDASSSLWKTQQPPTPAASGSYPSTFVPLQSMGSSGYINVDIPIVDAVQNYRITVDQSGTELNLHNSGVFNDTAWFTSVLVKLVGSINAPSVRVAGLVITPVGTPPDGSLGQSGIVDIYYYKDDFGTSRRYAEWKILQ